MNNTYFNNRAPFPGAPLYTANGIATPNQQTAQTQQMELPMEQSYLENILRLNKGKVVHVHATFPDSTEWRDKEFDGVIEQAGRDHLIISDPSDGRWYLIWMIYINYVTFTEKINYSPEFIPGN